MINIISVGLGAALGAIGRYVISILCKMLAPSAVFPLATLAVNMIGSIFIGLAAVVFERQGAVGSAAQLFVMTGIMGGFTTFSSFSLETFNLASDGKIEMAALNILVSVAVCLFGVWLGRNAASLLV